MYRSAASDKNSFQVKSSKINEKMKCFSLIASLLYVLRYRLVSLLNLKT